MGYFVESSDGNFEPYETYNLEDARDIAQTLAGVYGENVTIYKGACPNGEIVEMVLVDD